MALKNETPDVTDVVAKPGGAAPESLDNIAREADLLDTSPEREAQAGQVAQVEETIANNESELFEALDVVRALAFPLLAMVTDEGRMHALAEVWNDDVLKRSASAGAKVMEKHGWNMGSVAGEYGCYLMLAAAVAPPIVLTKKILETPKEKPKAPPAAPTPNGQQQ
ncbi:hypothetical protein [Variovorax gossypii]